MATIRCRRCDGRVTAGTGNPCPDCEGSGFLIARDVLRKLLNTVEATGGLVAFEDGTRAPVADPEWLDLGDVCTLAAELLGVDLPTAPAGAG